MAQTRKRYVVLVPN